MSVIHSHMKLALALALLALAPLACNNQKAELTEEEEELAAETQSDATPTRDNRSVESGDAAFIKIFPDGELIPTRGETTTASVPVSATATPAPTPASSTTAATSESPQEDPAPVEDAAPSTPTTELSGPVEETTEPANESTTPLTADMGNSPAPEPAYEPAPAPPIAAPAPDPVEEPTAISKELEDTLRPVLAVNESSASQLISVLPKENRATVSIGKHNDFIPGAYAIFAKWTADSKKVKVKVANDKADKDCAIDENATDGEWKTLGVFYLTKKAKVVITNNKNSKYAVKNELLLKPVIAENLTKPSKFKCLGGQIKGHGLVGFQ